MLDKFVSATLFIWIHTCPVDRTSVDGRRIRINKNLDTNVSSIVWTGPYACKPHCSGSTLLQLVYIFQEEENMLYQKKLEENRLKAEEKTAKKRAKR